MKITERNGTDNVKKATEYFEGQSWPVKRAQMNFTT